MTETSKNNHQNLSKKKEDSKDNLKYQYASKARSNCH